MFILKIWNKKSFVSLFFDSTALFQSPIHFNKLFEVLGRAFTNLTSSDIIQNLVNTQTKHFLIWAIKCFAGFAATTYFRTFPLFHSSEFLSRSKRN